MLLLLLLLHAARVYRSVRLQIDASMTRVARARA